MKGHLADLIIAFFESYLTDHYAFVMCVHDEPMSRKTEQDSCETPINQGVSCVLCSVSNTDRFLDTFATLWGGSHTENQLSTRVQSWEKLLSKAQN